MIEFSIIDIEEGYVHNCGDEIAFNVDDPHDIIGEICSAKECENIGCGDGEENPEYGADEEGFAMGLEKVIFDP